MTPEQEIERYKKDFAKQWPRPLTIPEFKKAVDENDSVRVGEIASREVKGNYHSREIASKLRQYE